MAEQFGIKTRVIDLTAQKELAIETMSQVATLSQARHWQPWHPVCGCLPSTPSAPVKTAWWQGRQRQRVPHGLLYQVGDGAYDLNPIADLTATEVFEFLRYLKAPQAVITKAPSAGLFEGQTDEEDMGVTYAAIDKYITTGEANEHDKAIIDRYHARSAHKRRDPLRYHGE